MPAQVGDNAEGVRVVGRILTAARSARWPMYLRNVKQILRQTEGGFDERRYGFGGLMDLLKACQREGFVRIERDRRGGLRVFPGQALQRTAVPSLPQRDIADEMHDEQPLIPVEPYAGIERDMDAQPAVDPTAELLGRAKSKRGGRAKAAPEGGARRKRPSSTTAAKRGSRSKKAAASDDDQIGNQ
jgi:hypothetical protein